MIVFEKKLIGVIIDILVLILGLTIISMPTDNGYKHANCNTVATVKVRKRLKCHEWENGLGN